MHQRFYAARAHWASDPDTYDHTVLTAESIEQALVAARAWAADLPREITNVNVRETTYSVAGAPQRVRA